MNSTPLTPYVNNLLELKQISFERDNAVLFENISAELSASNILEIRGTNGCGKSTLLRLLAGYIQIADNTLLWNKQCASNHKDVYQQQLHYLGHLNALKANLTVTENLQHSIALLGKNDFLSIRQACEKMGLGHQAFSVAGKLSAGQARRLALARLLLNAQPLWILDEPATALDSEGQALLSQMLSEHQARGGISIVATHQDLPGITADKTLRLGAQYA